jgi:hypothetical protein
MGGGLSFGMGVLDGEGDDGALCLWCGVLKVWVHECEGSYPICGEAGYRCVCVCEYIHVPID